MPLLNEFHSRSTTSVSINQQQEEEQVAQLTENVQFSRDKTESEEKREQKQRLESSGAVTVGGNVLNLPSLKPWIQRSLQFGCRQPLLQRTHTQINYLRQQHPQAEVTSNCECSYEYKVVLHCCLMVYSDLHCAVCAGFVHYKSCWRWSGQCCRRHRC